MAESDGSEIQAHRCHRSSRCMCCMISYHPSDIDSDKITNNVSNIISELITKFNEENVDTAGEDSAHITKLCHTSTPEEKDEAKRVWQNGRKMFTIFIITKDIVQEAPGFLAEMTEVATLAKTSNILTVFYKVTQEAIPQKLRNHVTLDYGVPDFKDRLISMVQIGKIRQPDTND